MADEVKNENISAPELDPKAFAAPGSVGAAALTGAAREKVLGAAADKGASITVKFEAEDKALHAKILADSKADDREPNKYLLRWIRQNYKVA